jgi:aldehyde:ferredoxin oxidoreductase
VNGGWVGKILFIDLTSGELQQKDTLPYVRNYLGGRGLAARLAWETIPPGTDAFVPENRLIIATGPLTGTLSPTGGRTIMTAVSPRTYPFAWYTHSTLGGWFGPELKYAGFDAFVISGRAAFPVYIEIKDSQVRLVEANSLWELDSYQTQLCLKERLHPQAQVLAIGPAGENLVRFATVQHAEENAAGHSGFGAVWGSKHLKAIAVKGTGSVPVARPEALLEEISHYGVFKTVPTGGALEGSGSLKRRPICSQACTFNCLVSSYEQAADGRLVPGQCVGSYLMAIRGNQNKLKATYYTGGGVEVPAGRSFGLCEEVALKESCNRLGLDLWHRLVMQPWLVACEQHGIHQIRGFPIAPADVFWYENFQEQLAHRRGLGELLADDLRRAMDALEGELPPDLIDLGRRLEFGFGFPAHREGRFWDEEPLPFWVISAMMYASESRDPTIGTHQSVLLLADLVLENRALARQQLRLVSQKTWGDPEALEPSFENKAPVAIWCQNMHMLIDSLPLCDFAFPQVIRPFRDRQDWLESQDISGDLDLDLRLLRAVTGVDYNRLELTLFSERAVTLERLMLARFGRSRLMEEQLAPHFQLPCRADGTLIDPQGFSRLLDEYYSARGWDLKTGWPQPEQLIGLGLEEAVEEIEGLYKERFGISYQTP